MSGFDPVPPRTLGENADSEVAVWGTKQTLYSDRRIGLTIRGRPLHHEQVKPSHGFHRSRLVEGDQSLWIDVERERPTTWSRSGTCIR